MEHLCNNCIHYMRFVMNDTENIYCLCNNIYITGNIVSECSKYNNNISETNNNIKEIVEVKETEESTISFNKEDIKELIKNK